MKMEYAEEKALIGNKGFMDLRKGFEEMGYIVDFNLSPVAHYSLKKNGKEYLVTSEKHADGFEFVINGIGFGIDE